MEQSALSLQELRGLDEGLSGCIRVTTLGTLVTILAEVIAAMRARSPRHTFELIYDTRTADLIRGEADVALRLGTMKNTSQPSLVARKLVEEDWSIFGSEGYVLERARSLPICGGTPSLPITISSRARRAVSGWPSTRAQLTW